MEVGARPLPPPVARPRPTSLLVGTLSASRARLLEELEARVPRELARVHQRDAGDAGKVSYSVQRGGFDLRVAGSTLELHAPISAEAELCKELGPLCVTYGRCSPRFDARVSAPAIVGPGFSLPRARVEVTLTRSCSVLGFDATGELKRIAAEQAQLVERRVNAALPEPGGAIRQLWRALAAPIALSAESCLWVTPTALIQAPLRAEPAQLQARLGVRGTLTLERPCTGEARPPSEPPDPSVEPLPALSQLSLPVALRWDDVSAELSRTATGAAGGLRVLALRAEGASSGHGNVLALTVTVDGGVCGELRLTATPSWSPSERKLRLTRLALVEPSLAPRLRPLLEHLAAKASVSLPFGVDSVPSSLQALLESAAVDELLTPRLVEVTVDVPDVLIERGALVPVLRLRGELSAGLR